MIAAHQIAFGKAAGKGLSAKSYLEFDFTQSMFIPNDYYVYKKEIEFSFSAAQLDNTRRIVFGRGGSAKAYFDIKDNKFPYSWITSPPVMEADVIYKLKIEGNENGSVSVALDDILLASDFNTHARAGFAIGSYANNSGTNFSGRIFCATSYDERGNVLHYFIPAVVDGVPCLKDDVGNIVVYADAGTANPVYGELVE